ncbi:Competence protein A [compost metagenome]
MQDWALEPLPATAMHNGWITDPEQVGVALRQAVGRCAGRCRRAAIALPGALVIEKVVMVPVGLDDQAVAERLMSDIGQWVPFALDDAAIDFKVVEPGVRDPLNQQVVVAVCHLAMLDVLQASLEFAGLRACVVEPDAHALRRAMQSDDALEGVVLQVEAESLVIHEQAAGPMPLRREVFLAGHEDLVKSLATAVDNYLLSRPGRPLPNHLLLVGGGVGDEYLPRQLQQRLGLEVRLGNPFRGLSLAPGLESRSLQAQAPYLAIACGLAMREGDRCLG